MVVLFSSSYHHHVIIVVVISALSIKLQSIKQSVNLAEQELVVDGVGGEFVARKLAV